MTAKIVEVVAEILEGLQKNHSLEELTKNLSKNNLFDQQTISAAFGLVYDKVLSEKISRNKRKREKSNKFRLLTSEEIDAIGKENHNYLLHLFNVGLLNIKDLEMVLEQILMYPEDTVTKEDINWTIFISLVEFNADILPGSRLLLYSSDTIN